MCIKLEQIFGLLEGSWVIHRTMTGTAGVSLGSFKGTALFTPSQKRKDILHYREEGQLQTPKKKVFPAFQTYVYWSNEEGIDVYFGDGEPPRLFHRIQLEKTQGVIKGSGAHECSKDNYQLRYSFPSCDIFSIFCKVLGPKKDYVIRTEFSRRIN